MRLALAQIRVDPGQPDSNLARACRRIAEAAAAGADLVLLPETLDLGWTHSSARSLAQPIPSGWPCQVLAQAARAVGIHVAAGLTERDGNHVFNAAVLVGPDGRLLLHHRKINELAIGHACYDPGDRLGVVQLPFGKVGLMICADAFIEGESISRTLGAMGADLILSPCAWAVPPAHDPAHEPYGALWEDCHGRVAREFGLVIAATSCVGPIVDGPWVGRPCIGNSIVTGKDGSTISRCSYGVDAEVLKIVELPPLPPRPRRSTER